MTHPLRIAPVTIAAQGLASAAGVGIDALATLLRRGETALRPLPDPRAPLATCVGAVPGADDVALPPALAAWDSRATRIAWLALQSDGYASAVEAAVQRHGAARVALVVGTSASTIAVSEAAYRAGGFAPWQRSETLNTLHAVTAFVQQALGIEGPACTVSTACSSSAKALAQAERWLRLGLADAVVAGGVDALGDSLLYGFNALGLLSPRPCRPFDTARDGISVGEAAGFVLLQRGVGALMLLGHGESNDAHHMSSPHPEGLGAELALDAALARAGVAPGEVGYLNLHGTASARNDEVEAALVARRFGAATHASATKGATGHTMGAAGVVEALVCLQALRSGELAGTPGCEVVDPVFGRAFADVLHCAPARRAVDVAVSHSFGFGGNNAVLVFGRG